MHTNILTTVENGTGTAKDAGALRARIQAYVQQPFGLFADLVRLQVDIHPEKTALICDEESMNYKELDDLADRIAAKLQRQSAGPGAVVAICSATSIPYIAVFLGILRSGAAASPLSPSATGKQLLNMLADSRASHLFTDESGSAALEAVSEEIGAQRISLEGGATGQPLVAWMAEEGSRPRPAVITPETPFNIIYSSGTTGTPKGIVQPHSMRWPQLHLLDPPGYGVDAVAILSTPLYSNTTLVSLLPALAGGGTVVLMARFDARSFLELSERHRVTVAMLVPVQFQRILDVPDFDRFDLSSYQLKYVTSAPFTAELKAVVLARWPGGLVEYFGMTEGGGTCMLVAHERPDKLHTVGQPIEGHEMRVIDEQGRQVAPGEAGEVVGRSRIMMTGYHNQPSKTSEAEWYSPEGERFIRTGDIGRVDEEGFFTLIGRKKDMIISGGMNIYPSDLESVLREHPAVLEAAVIGAPSKRWGETPVGFVTARGDAKISGSELKEWANVRLGKMQRLSDVRIVAEMPRNTIGKILKRELQVLCAASPVD
jgi:long-chain acyl-CoA synthetase